VRIFRRGARSACEISAFRIEKMKSAEPRKLTASKRMAAGALSQPMSRPATPGPPSCAADRLISSLALPSMICRRSTSEGRYDWYATSKNTVATPTKKPTPYSCQIVSASKK